jgi:hypothetical protein
MIPEEVKFVQLAFGVRFHPHFELEDNFGAILDKILEHDRFSSTRFPRMQQGHGLRQLLGEGETLTLSRQDVILDSIGGLDHVEDALPLAQQFAEGVWRNVYPVGRSPSVIRFGCLVGFHLPPNWTPISAFVGAPDNPTSEFTLRFSHRLPSEEALTNKRKNDHFTSIYQIACKDVQRTGTIDFQHHFSPALEDRASFKDYSFERFVERAIKHFNGKGWKFLKERFDRLEELAA